MVPFVFLSFLFLFRYVSRHIFYERKSTVEVTSMEVPTVLNDARDDRTIMKGCFASEEEDVNYIPVVV